MKHPYLGLNSQRKTEYILRFCSAKFHKRVQCKLSTEGGSLRAGNSCPPLFFLPLPSNWWWMPFFVCFGGGGISKDASLQQATIHLYLIIFWWQILKINSTKGTPAHSYWYSTSHHFSIIFYMLSDSVCDASAVYQVAYCCLSSCMPVIIGTSSALAQVHCW